MKVNLMDLKMFAWPLLTACVLCCSPSLAKHTPAPFSSTRLKPAHINVQEIKSKEGIIAWIVETHEVPVVSVALAFKNAGAANDPKGFMGLAQLLSGMLDEGAGDWDSQQFKRFLLEKNIELSISASQDVFQLNFRTIKKNIGEAFALLKAILTKPRFDQTSLARVKSQLLSILEQSLHNEQTIANQKLHSILYGNHPYGRTVQEVLRDLPNITEAQLNQFMKERFARDQLLVSIVGDITPEEVQNYLDKTFADLPKNAKPTDVKDLVLPKKGITVIEPLTIPQSYIRFAQPGISRTDPDFYKVFVLTKILGEGQYESRLWNDIREERGLTYDIDANVHWSQHSALILGETSTKCSNVKEVRNLIQKAWTKMREGATQSELDYVKKRLLGSFALNFSSTIKIAQALLIYQIDNLGKDYINKRNDILAGITLEDINKIARSLLNPEQLTFVIVGDPKELSCQVLTQEQNSGRSRQ